MRVKTLIEALETANSLFRSEHKKDMEIFDLVFSEDELHGDLYIHACGEVVYRSDAFGYGEKVGKKPQEDIRIHFECEDGKIDDRSVEFTDELK